MIIRKINREDNDLELVYDFFMDECYHLYDWKKLKAYEFETWEDCSNGLKGLLHEDLYSYFVSCKEMVEKGDSVGIDRDALRTIPNLKNIYKGYSMFKERAPEKLKELLARYERTTEMRLNVDPIRRYRFLYLFDPENRKSITDEANNYNVYSWYVDNGEVFYVGYSKDVPELEKKHSCQTAYWNMLLNHHNFSNKIEALGLTEKQAIILSNCLQLDYTQNGHYVLGYNAESYRDYLEGGHKVYVNNRTLNHVFIDGFYKDYFPDFINYGFIFEYPSIEGVSDTAFISESWSEKKLIVERWISYAGGRIRKKVGKTSKSVIINEEPIDFAIYLQCKNAGCKMYLIDDMISFIKTNGYFFPVVVPQYDLKARDTIRRLLVTVDIEVSKLEKYSKLELQNRRAFTSKLDDRIILEIAIAQRNSITNTIQYARTMLDLYTRGGLFEEALNVCRKIIDEGVVSIDEKEELLVEIDHLKKIIAVDSSN